MIASIPRAFLIGSFCLACFIGCGKQSDLAPFERDAYFANPDNLLGNKYQLTATIDSTLGYDAKVGRLIAVREAPELSRVPLFIGPEIVENLHVGQRYNFEVEVKEGGLVSVTNMEKF